MNKNKYCVRIVDPFPCSQYMANVLFAVKKMNAQIGIYVNTT